MQQTNTYIFPVIQLKFERCIDNFSAARLSKFALSIVISEANEKGMSYWQYEWISNSRVSI